MVKYLVFFSYIGCGYSGLQSQKKGALKTVGSVIQEALRVVSGNIAPLEDRSADKFVFASRTDKGVHALCNAGHIYFDSPSYENLDPNEFSKHMNSTLMDMDENIRFLKTIRVPETFHSRYHATSRSYAYRLCILDRGTQDPAESEDCIIPPLFDRRRSMLIGRPVDMDLVREAGKILTGSKDFRAFTTSGRRRLVELEGDTGYGMKSLKNMEVKLLREPHFISPENTSRFYNGSIQFWSILFKSNSYLYRQVRKMTATMLSVGFGDLSLRDLEKLLDESTSYTLGPNPATPLGSLLAPNSPSVTSAAQYSSSPPTLHRPKRPELVSPLSFCFTVPSSGLYLTNVEYPQEILTGRATDFECPRKKNVSDKEDDEYGDNDD